MVLCQLCSNKRCPHANDHRNTCTGSNAPGQLGSAYAESPEEMSARIVRLTYERDEAISQARTNKNAAFTLRKLQAISTIRCETWHPVADWSPTDWGCAMAGEAGETCNMLKKMRRGDFVPLVDVGKEIADTVLYAVLLAERLGIDLQNAVIDKFNEFSDRVGSPIKIEK
jgi:NTP pyrophosphatase (non-canonical NTP hydrolase)